MTKLRQKTGVVLCVDDNEQHLATLKAIVKMEGHTALTASSYEEAVEVLNNEAKIDVLLTDYKMGTLSGIDLCEYTQEHFPLIRKVIVTSMQSVLDMHNHFAKIDAVVMKVSTAQERINEIIHDKLARDALRERMQTNSGEDA